MCLLPTTSMFLPLMVIVDRKSTRLNSSHLVISYAVFCLKKKNEPSCPARGAGQCSGCARHCYEHSSPPAAWPDDSPVALRAGEAERDGATAYRTRQLGR